MPSGIPKRRWPVYALFLAVLVVLPVQEFVRDKVGEPFPSLVMPGFGGVPDNGQTYVVTKGFVTAGFEDGTRRTLPVTDLFDDFASIPEAAARHFTFRGLTVDGADATRPSSTLRQLLAGQERGRDREDRSAIIDSPGGAAWLRARITDVFDRPGLERATVVWRRMEVDRDTREIVSSAPVKTVEVLPR